LLARHSTAALTLDRYARMQAVDLASAVEALPSVPLTGPEKPSEVLRATGTTGRAANPVAVPVAGNVPVSIFSDCPASSRDGLEPATDSFGAHVENPVSPRVSDSPRPASSRDFEERRWSELNRRWRICNPLP
jgi:hypothetical protein